MTETPSQIPHIKVSSPFVPKYTASEIALLNKHKDEYLKAAGPAGRKQYFKAFIWPEMFTYWYKQKGEIIRDQANTIAKDLASWVHNTWRPKSKASGPVMHLRKSQYVWEYMNEEVWKEISKLLGVEKADAHTPNWFAKRTLAISQIVARMTLKEVEEMEGAIAKIEVEGHSEDVRRRNANRHCTNRLDTSAKANWLEMGALSLSFVTYSTPTGQLAVEVHETAAELVGVRFDSFDDRHPDRVVEIQRLWLEYVRDIIDKKTGVQPNKLSNSKNSVLPTTAEGYPYLPAEIITRDLNKKAVVHLMRQYLRQNYFLATGRQSDQVPYSEFDKGARVRNKYVDPQYLPNNFALTDPHNHKADQIKEFLEFIQKRQLMVPYADVFRFGRVKSTRKKGDVTRTYYPNEIDQSNPPEFKKKVPKKMAARNRPDKHKADFASVENSDVASAEPSQQAFPDADTHVPPEPMDPSLINFNGKIVDFTPAYYPVHCRQNEFNPNMNGVIQQTPVPHPHEDLDPNVDIDGLRGFDNTGIHSGHMQNTPGRQTYSDLTRVPLNWTNTPALQNMQDLNESRTMQYQVAPNYFDPSMVAINNIPNLQQRQNIQYQAAPNYADPSRLSGNVNTHPVMANMPYPNQSLRVQYQGADEFPGYVGTNGNPQHKSEIQTFDRDEGFGRRLFLPSDVVGSNQENDRRPRGITTENADRQQDAAAHREPDFNFPPTLFGGCGGSMSQIPNCAYGQQAICTPTVSMPDTDTRLIGDRVPSNTNPCQVVTETHPDIPQKKIKPRPKKTVCRADDLAIQEAEVVVGKRARKVKVRE